MIQGTTKLVTISPVTAQEQARMRLDTADGRFSIAERLMADIEEWSKYAFDDGPRSHLGASIIAKPCDRDIWYSWRWFKHHQFGGTLQRLFQDGHWYEQRFIEMLTGIGCKITQVAEDGEQQRIYAVQGHFGGSTDGGAKLPERYGVVAQLGDFLLECKTMNTANFGKFHDAKESKPQHWGQMCVYGVKLGLRYAIYLIVNKNNSEIYIEIVELDWEYGQNLINKGEWIIFSQVPPPKISNNPSDYRCKLCDHHAVCQLNATPDANCRTCTYSSPIDNKQWLCNRWGAVIPSKEAMIEGCQGYTQLQVI